MGEKAAGYTLRAGSREGNITEKVQTTVWKWDKVVDSQSLPPVTLLLNLGILKTLPPPLL